MRPSTIARTAASAKPPPARRGADGGGLYDFSSVFFFQAEDGIRDYKVTGVHVCSSDLEEGHAMLEHARGVFAAIDGMEAEAALLGSSLQGKATLAANSSSLHGFIGPHVGEFLTAFPEVNLTLVEQTSETIAASVAEGEADLGVYAGEPMAGAVACETFAQDRLVVIAPPGHPLVPQPGERPEDGEGPSCRFFDTLAHAFVGMALTSSNYAFLRELAKRHGRPLRCRQIGRAP